MVFYSFFKNCPKVWSRVDSIKGLEANSQERKAGESRALTFLTTGLSKWLNYHLVDGLQPWGGGANIAPRQGVLSTQHPYLLTTVQRSVDQTRHLCQGEGIGEHIGNGCRPGVPARWHLCHHGARRSRLSSLDLPSISSVVGTVGSCLVKLQCWPGSYSKGQMMCCCPFWSVGGALLPPLPAGLGFA